ncbi:hypothetical protein [Stutzerimonas stutzeri]|uniref:hypothetical protein n=1 Tax=Stutzerimonas stutzeri TaxID=316 RepID=UPI0002D28087|nr:hypothetical protein [Stutzerimonas stutzeri]
MGTDTLKDAAYPFDQGWDLDTGWKPDSTGNRDSSWLPDHGWCRRAESPKTNLDNGGASFASKPEKCSFSAT